MLRRIAVLCVFTASVIATSCTLFSGEPLAPIAIVRGDSTVTVLYGRCTDEEVQRVSIQRVDDSSGGIVSGPVLWEIQSEGEGSSSHLFAVGETPGGFKTVVPLKEPLPADRKLAITVDSSRFEGTKGIRLSEAKAGLAYFDGKNMGEEEFLERFGC